MMQPFPVSSPLHGTFWTWVVPVLLFVLTFVATWLLYRHFANQGPKDGTP